MKKMEKAILINVLFAMLLFVFSSVSLAEMKPIKLKFATPFAPPSVSLGGESAQIWMDEVTNRTNGKITFETFWGGCLGKAPEHISLLQKGVIDVGFIYPWWTPGKLPLGVFENAFPFGPVDPVLVYKAKRQMYAEFPHFKKDYAKQNCLLLQVSGSTAYQLLSKVKVRSLADFKGKKVMVMGRYLGDWISACGAVPVGSDMPSRYNMLQTGVGDMDLLPIDVQASLKHYEQAKYQILIDAFAHGAWDIVMNINSFNKLPKEAQDIIIEARLKTEPIIAGEIVEKWADKARKVFEENNVETIRLAEVERTKWANMVPDTPALWAKEVSDQGYPGWEIVNRYQEITTQLGYKWPRTWGIRK
jgi:TRAP-type transport system periplasmic protein